VPGLSDGGEPQAGSTCALAGLQHIVRASLLEVGASPVSGFPAASLPLLTPWVRGDSVGYYALVRAPLIEHNLDATDEVPELTYS